MLTIILILLTVFSAFLHIRAEYHGLRQQVYIFKPLTMIFVLLIAIIIPTTLPLYKYLIVTGLFFSLLGDIFLMLPSDRFVPGLIAFLIAHLFYIAAFTLEISVMMWWPIIPITIYGIVIFNILAPSLYKLKWPVLIYIMVIMIMVWLAWERWPQASTGVPLLAFIGAALFVISDTTLALSRFWRKFKLSIFLKLSTYFAAQCLIASSV